MFQKILESRVTRPPVVIFHRFLFPCPPLLPNQRPLLRGFPLPSSRVFYTVTFVVAASKQNQMSRHPEVQWAQRIDKVFITVLLPDAKNVKVGLEPDGLLSFSAKAGPEHYFYEVKLELYNKVNVEESKIIKGDRNSLFIVEKAEKGWWKKLLRGDGKTPHYIKVDWNKWVDEDDDGDLGANDFDFGGMDFSKFGDTGDDMDADDDEGEVEKPEDIPAPTETKAGKTNEDEEMDAAPSK